MVKKLISTRKISPSEFLLFKMAYIGRSALPHSTNQHDTIRRPYDFLSSRELTFICIAICRCERPIQFGASAYTITDVNICNISHRCQKSSLHSFVNCLKNIKLVKAISHFLYEIMVLKRLAMLVYYVSCVNACRNLKNIIL